MRLNEPENKKMQTRQFIIGRNKIHHSTQCPLQAFSRNLLLVAKDPMSPDLPHTSASPQLKIGV
jgi:hypothetical protein